MKIIRYIVFVPYLSYIAMMGGNVLVEATIIGFVLGMYDTLFSNGGGRPV